jgi:DNA-binding IclR family transcriptional regulator
MSTIVRGAEVLKKLCKGTHRLSDISRQLRFSKASTHRLLDSLQRAGLVAQDPVTSHYYIGPLIFQLSSNPLVVHGNLIEPALEDLKQLNYTTHETVALFIRLGTQRICLEELPSAETIKYVAGRGYAVPVHLGSPGKILLAQMSDDELEKLLDKIEFDAKPSKVGREKQLLKREVAKARKDRFAVGFGQRVPGSASLSVAIRNYVAPVALTVLGPQDRIRAKTGPLLKEMKLVAGRISRRLKERGFDNQTESSEMRPKIYALGRSGQGRRQEEEPVSE